MNNDQIAIGVDVGGHHISSIAVDISTGSTISSSCSRIEIDAKANKTEILNHWHNAIETTINCVDSTSIQGIGFAMPGPFDYRSGIALFSGNEKYEALYGVDIASEFAHHFELAPNQIRFINDATAFAIGCSDSVASGYNRIIAITLGTGFGTAFIDEKIPVIARDDVPEQGCLWHVPYGNGIIDDYISARWFVREYEKVCGHKIKGVKEIAELTRAVNKIDCKSEHKQELQKIFDQFGERLGEVLAPWVNKFNAEAIVVGGNISQSYDLFSDNLKRIFKEHNVKTDIVVCNVAEDAAMLGGARLVDDGFWEKVRNSLSEK